MTDDSTRQADDHHAGEIEITGEMIEAGISALLDYADDFVGGFSHSWQERVVVAVYECMAARSSS
jgi:hypothetical protein